MPLALLLGASLEELKPMSSSLTRIQQTEVASIVDEALAVTPKRHQTELMQAFSYLAVCFVEERNQAHLADIQKLIDAAKANDALALGQMQNQLLAEMQQLRQQTSSGFEKVSMCLSLMKTQHNQLEQRLLLLEQRRPEVLYVESKPVQNYYIDNSYTDNSFHSSTTTTGGNIEALAWTIVAIFFTVLACSLLPYGRR
jgi:hypothetical protein